MARTRSYRVLPTGPLLAAINASLPSGTNPFVTMDEFLAQSFINGVVFDYNALPDPTTVPNSFYWASNAVTHTTLFITFTDYPKGMYYSNGVSWEFTNIPIQASLLEINTGTDKNKFVTSYTFTNASKWGTKADIVHTHTLSDVTDVTISTANLNSLDDGVNSTLHFHDSDRARANHTGTQTSSTISDFASTVLGTLLSGLSVATAQVIASTDTILQAFGYLQAQISLRVVANTAIVGATKTKVTYDSKGLVTSGADATTADINDSTNRRYVTDTQLVVIGNTSNTNSGDQTSVVGITGTKAQFDTACTDGNFLYVGDVPVIQRGVIAAGSFAGNPKKYTLTFPIAFADANYSLSIIGVDARTWSVDTAQTSTQVVINANANLALTGNVYWTATKH